jgi:hypothetical protein
MLPLEECENWSLTLIAGPANTAAASPVGAWPAGTNASRHAKPAIGSSEALAANVPLDVIWTFETTLNDLVSLTV